jgi:hypothetical protein
MRIGIDISQAVYEGTGVAQYVDRLVGTLLEIDDTHEYVLFFANRHAGMLRSDLKIIQRLERAKVSYKLSYWSIPVAVFEFLWNRLHVIPIEWLIGEVDIFYTSDWVEPPVRSARKITTIHDLSILRVPETFDRRIVSVHKRKLRWVKIESSAILCDSKATRDDAIELLGIENDRLHVVYPGI